MQDELRYFVCQEDRRCQEKAPTDASSAGNLALVTVTMTPYAKVALIKEINIVDCSLYISDIIAVLRIFVGHILAEMIRKLKIPKN